MGVMPFLATCHTCKLLYRLMFFVSISVANKVLSLSLQSFRCLATFECIFKQPNLDDYFLFIDASPKATEFTDLITANSKLTGHVDTDTVLCLSKSLILIKKSPTASVMSCVRVCVLIN